MPAAVLLLLLYHQLWCLLLWLLAPVLAAAVPYEGQQQYHGPERLLLQRL